MLHSGGMRTTSLGGFPRPTAQAHQPLAAVTIRISEDAYATPSALRARTSLSPGRSRRAFAANSGSTARACEKLAGPLWTAVSPARVMVIVSSA